MSQSDQNFKNHAKMVPAYHYWMIPMLVLPSLYLGYGVVVDFSVAGLAAFIF